MSGFHRSVAVVAGIEKYERAGVPAAAQIPDLKAAANDARAVESLLTRLGYEVTRLGETADKEALLAALSEAAGSLTPDDRFVFYFAGHGVVSGKRDKDGFLPGYLVLHGAASDDERTLLDM